MLKINRCQTAAVNVLLMMNASRTIEVLFFYPSLSFSLFPSAYWKAGLFCLSPAEMTEFQLTTERNGCHMLKKSGPHKPRTQSVLLDTSKKKAKEKEKVDFIVCFRILAFHSHKSVWTTGPFLLCIPDGSAHTL